MWDPTALPPVGPEQFQEPTVHNAVSDCHMSEQITACLSLTYFIIVMPALYARDYTSPSFVF